MQPNGRRLALITTHDPSDARHFSGIVYYAVRSLRARGVDVTWIGPFRRPRWRERQVRRVLHALHRDYVPKARALEREAREDASDLARRLQDAHYDAVLGMVCSQQLAYLETELPIIYVTDAVFRLLDGLFSYATSLPNDVKQVLDAFECSALEKASAICIGSDWAADGARNLYGTPYQKVHTVPLGANLERLPEFRERTISAGKRLELVLPLKFGGEDTWQRKGGDVAVETVRLLNASGVPARLTIVGMIVPTLPPAEWIRNIGYLDKNNPSDYAKFCEILESSDLLILPARAEASGMVTAEAAAMGIPVVTRRIGGLATVIEHGVTGILVDPQASAEQFASAVRHLVEVPERFSAMSRAARARFESTLSWDAWSRRLLECIDALRTPPPSAMPSLRAVSVRVSSPNGDPGGQ